jgi:hypothetical protein
MTNSEGNHGEDVKEYYFYLDSTPTHSYMKYLYKYPQAAYPYADLVNTNRQRTRQEQEYELIDTGVFNQDRYFDVFVEYAKESPEDLLIKVSIYNRGPQAAHLQVLPTLWFRNTWSWDENTPKPVLKEVSTARRASLIAASHPVLGERFLYCEGKVSLLFTENETNTERICGIPNKSPYVKDGIHRHIVNGEPSSVNPQRTGTKASAHYLMEIEAGGSKEIRLRLCDVPPSALGKTYAKTNGDPFGPHFDRVLKSRKDEADEFYEAITPPSLGEDARNVMRQALAGMLWSKQYYSFDLGTWLKEHNAHPLLLASHRDIRNRGWYHMV